MAAFEKDSRETTMDYGVPIRGPTHIHVFSYIGCGAWFWDLLDMDKCIALYSKSSYKDRNSTFLATLRKNALARWPDGFAPVDALPGFLNDELLPSGLLQEPLGDVFRNDIAGASTRRASRRSSTPWRPTSRSCSDVLSAVSASGMNL